ncbi:MAG TPA: branched-chain amino acid ABC transporter permease [Solirubrobacteraceae bacterium]|jgi:branched-chain amino acid transport system permease protein|nr:branched-chain amino acid ABC transporter permease [Solirubrobacteraceae bacterium]
MLQVLLSGLAIGAIYGLVGMGFAIAFYVTRVINFAEGQLLMVAVLITAALARGGMSPVLALVIGILASAAMGAAIYLLAVRPVLAFDRFSFAWLVSTLGVALMLENGAALIWGPTSRSFPALLNGTSLHIGDATLTLQEAVTIGVAVVLPLAFEAFRRRTLFGKLGMAIAHDPEMARACGANTAVVATVAFAIAGAFAGVAGILIGPITYSNPYLGDSYGIAGFVALMIGGTARPVAAVAGGFLLGVLGEAANHVINTQASDWFPFVVVVVILLFAPEGLLSLGAPLRRLVRGRRGGRLAEPAA